MSTTATYETGRRTWRRAVTALAALGDWLEREAIPTGLVDDTVRWEAFLRRLWPVLRGAWGAQTQEEIRTAADVVVRLMKRQHVYGVLEAWLPAVSPAGSLFFATSPDLGDTRGVRPLPPHHLAAVRATMKAMISQIEPEAAEWGDAGDGLQASQASVERRERMAPRKGDEPAEVQRTGKREPRAELAGPDAVGETAERRESEALEEPDEAGKGEELEEAQEGGPPGQRDDVEEGETLQAGREPTGRQGTWGRTDIRSRRERERAAEAGGAELPDYAPRYANAALVGETSGRRLDRRAAIPPGQVIRLRLDIGELSVESAVENPEPIPEHLLPGTDIHLDVMVSSTHFQVGSTRSNLGAAQIARGRFTLPKDGQRGRAPGGRKYLYFFLRAPVTRTAARARIGYYYRNHLVQSQVLKADIGDGSGAYWLETDYTLSQSLVDLEDLPARPQVSVVTNDNSDGRHQIIIRSSDETGEVLGSPCTYEVDEYAVGRLIATMRGVLRKAGIAPVQKKRRKDQLIRDLSELAPLGWQLWNAIVGPHFHELYDVLERYETVVLQVSRPVTSSYAFPWGLIYDIPLISDEELRVCSLVDQWDGVAEMVAHGIRRCPEAPNGHGENTLCPFGFWGYRYPIEQLSSTDKPVAEIPVSRDDSFDVLAVETERGIDSADLAAHIGALRRLLLAEFPRARLREAKSRATARELLGEDMPLVYFYCHGERPGISDPGVPSAIRLEQTYLGLDRNEKLTPTDIAGWVLEWRRQDGRKVWDRVRPLIFINACHSAEINPDTLVSYLDAFVGTAHAAGVIGTEVRVDQGLAMDVATEFFRRLFDGWTVDHALHAVRLDYLASGNLLGLVYTPYCMADLSLSTA